ncbi:glycosyltransferase [Pannonibacter phragmitetus]|uniref:glycosyltransferase n=1 Tax=Pannonibacter phragmitetus TaxID=121719 RepID=UPI000F454BAF|nr:glycosyltransferase [Pannonibacter phragmitetus]
MTDAPLISIITPSYNRVNFIDRCIASIPEHVRPWVEHVIVDGGSTDGTLEKLQNHPHVRWMSEPDKGLYDALNKGIRLAKGKYIGFLATDDFLDEAFFAAVKTHVDAHSDVEVFSFDFNIHNGDEVVIKRSSALDEFSIIYGDVSLFSMLIQRELLLTIMFDDSFRIAGDLETGLRLAKKARNKAHIDAVMLNFWRHEGSLTGHSSMARDREFDEVFRILKKEVIYSLGNNSLFSLIGLRFLQIGRYFYHSGGLRRFHGRFSALVMYVFFRFMRIFRIISE